MVKFNADTLFLMLLLGFMLDVSASTFDTNPYCKNIEDSIDKYACWTEQAAHGIKLSLPSLTEREMSIFKAIEAMNLVQNIASSARYSFYLNSDEEFMAPTMSEQILSLNRGIGICGNHQHIFIEILKRIGERVRPVDFYYLDARGKRNSHAAAEVKVGDKWIYFDITWGSYWALQGNDFNTLLSLDEIREGKGARFGGNNSWYLRSIYAQTENYSNNLFEYLVGNKVQTLRNKGGQLSVKIQSGIANFSHIPNYVGKAVNAAPLVITLTGKFESGTAVLDIAGVGGACKKSRLQVNDDRYPVVAGDTEIQIANNTKISIKGEDDICYAVISDIQLKQL